MDSRVSMLNVLSSGQAEGALRQICESVVVPNMQFREADAEAFADNPDEFIRKVNLLFPPTSLPSSSAEEPGIGATLPI